jgi:hypothetical protein
MTHGFKKTKANFVKFHVARRWCIFAENAFFLRHDSAAAARGAARARRLFFILFRAACPGIQPTLGYEGGFPAASDARNWCTRGVARVFEKSPTRSSFAQMNASLSILVPGPKRSDSRRDEKQRKADAPVALR